MKNEVRDRERERRLSEQREEDSLEKQVLVHVGQTGNRVTYVIFWFNIQFNLCDSQGRIERERVEDVQ